MKLSRRWRSTYGVLKLFVPSFHQANDVLRYQSGGNDVESQGSQNHPEDHANHGSGNKLHRMRDAATIV
jgi:hypothetical protein